MGGLFYSLGRLAGPHVRKARWTWYWATGTEADSIEAEYEVGLDLAAEVRKQFVPEPQKSELIGEIGAKLAGHIAKKQRRFSFEAIKDGPPNAFALPGGFIFITSSLMELCEFNSDEIAFILGHEMSHVIRGHAIERIITNSAISFGAKASGKTRHRCRINKPNRNQIFADRVFSESRDRGRYAGNTFGGCGGL